MPRSSPTSESPEAFKAFAEVVEAERVPHGPKATWRDAEFVQALAFAVERIFRLARPTWREEALRLRPAARAYVEGDAGPLRLLVGELEANQWAEVAATGALGSGRYPADHALANVGSASRATESNLCARALGLRDTLPPSVIPEMVPEWLPGRWRASVPAPSRKRRRKLPTEMRDLLLARFSPQVPLARVADNVEVLLRLAAIDGTLPEVAAKLAWDHRPKVAGPSLRVAIRCGKLPDPPLSEADSRNQEAFLLRHRTWDGGDDLERCLALSGLSGDLRGISEAAGDRGYPEALRRLLSGDIAGATLAAARAVSSDLESGHPMRAALAADFLVTRQRDSAPELLTGVARYLDAEGPLTALRAWGALGTYLFLDGVPREVAGSPEVWPEWARRLLTTLRMELSDSIAGLFARTLDRLEALRALEPLDFLRRRSDNFFEFDVPHLSGTLATTYEALCEEGGDPGPRWEELCEALRAWAQTGRFLPAVELRAEILGRSFLRRAEAAERSGDPGTAARLRDAAGRVASTTELLKGAEDRGASPRRVADLPVYADEERPLWFLALQLTGMPLRAAIAMGQASKEGAPHPAAWTADSEPWHARELSLEATLSRLPAEERASLDQIRRNPHLLSGGEDRFTGFPVGLDDGAKPFQKR